jgi:hypothetical protein
VREGGEELGEYIKMLNGKRVIDIEMVENFLNNSGFHKHSKRFEPKTFLVFFQPIDQTPLHLLNL